MPQLNPSPWFWIFIFTWLTLLVLLTPKVLTHQSVPSPSLPSQASSFAQPQPWQWP